MAVIQHTNAVHAASCVAAEGVRQSAVAAAKSAGSSAAIQAAVVTGEIAYYQSVIASAKAQGLPYAQFLEALRSLGVAL